MKPTYAQLVNCLVGAEKALRSYQYGNSSSDLAEEIADWLADIVRSTEEKETLGGEKC